MAATPTGQRPTIAAEAFLRALADHGTDYFFVNPGTDFPPIVEAFSRAKKTNAKVPKPILVPHENLAVGMAHGAYMMTGRPQAVMVHVNVGTANTINNLTNLSRDRVPLILAAGRTPITEKGTFGSRSRPIHWAQEMFDQAGMVRELVKWDYELRVPGQIGDVVARGVEVAMAHPRGPVYLVLPREPLAATLPEPVGPAKPRPQAAAAYPDPRTIATLAEWIAAAERPLIITSTLPAEAVPQLERLAERCAIPVVTHNPRSVCLPSSHSMHFGFEPGTLLTDADLVIALESDVPWIPHLQHPPGGCRVAHLPELGRVRVVLDKFDGVILPALQDILEEMTEKSGRALFDPDGVWIGTHDTTQAILRATAEASFEPERLVVLENPLFQKPMPFLDAKGHIEDEIARRHSRWTGWAQRERERGQEQAR